MSDMLQAGPCVICGGTNYNLSCGGPTICPKCDCGNFDAATVEKQAKVIAELRGELERSRGLLTLILHTESSVPVTPAIGGEAQFLLDRLEEYDPEDEDHVRDFHGHVTPAIARLRDALAQPASPLRWREWSEIADELMGWHDACTQNSSGGDGEFRVECSSGSDAQARGLRSSLRRAAKAIRDTASPPEQPAERPGYREYAALSIVEQAVKDMAGIGGGISGVTCQKMKKLIQTIEPCKRCGGSGLLETVECPNCDNGLVKSIPPEQPASPLRGREAALAKALTNLCDEIGNRELHGDGAHDEDCSICRSHKRARKLLSSAPPEQPAAVPAGKLACRRCGGWGTIRLGNMDRETCDLCNGTGNEPAAAPVPGWRPD